MSDLPELNFNDDSDVSMNMEPELEKPSNTFKPSDDDEMELPSPPRDLPLIPEHPIANEEKPRPKRTRRAIKLSVFKAKKQKVQTEQP